VTDNIPPLVFSPSSSLVSLPPSPASEQRKDLNPDLKFFHISQNPRSKSRNLHEFWLLTVEEDIFRLVHKLEADICGLKNRFEVSASNFNSILNVDANYDPKYSTQG